MAGISTEPEARGVLEGMKRKHKRKKKVYDDSKDEYKQGDKTGSSPEGMMKSKAEGEAELKRLRAKRAKKIAAAKKK